MALSLPTATGRVPFVSPSTTTFTDPHSLTDSEVCHER